MATTARDLIQDALEKLGVYAPGETMSDADAQRGLTVLSDMLDSWSNESLTCFAITEQSVALVAGTSAYTIGSGGTINLTRPLRLIEGPGAAYILDGNSNKYPLDVVPQDKWNMIGNTGGQVNANVPNTLFYDPQYPLGILNFYPQPNVGGYTAYWDSYLQLTDPSALTSSITLPPGYNAALKANLAVWLKPYFTGAQLDPDVREQARETKAIIKRTNIRTNEALYDSEIVSRSRGAYNPYTDRGG